MIVAPPSKCPACGTGVPWGSVVEGGAHRYECLSCRHVFEVRAVVASQAAAPSPFAPGPPNPYAAAPTPLIPQAAPMAARVCPSCRKENAPHYKFCLGCGGDLYAVAAHPVVGSPFGAPAPKKRSRALIGGIIGFNGIFWAAFTLFFLSPKACALFSPGNEDLAIETLKQCPRARQLLGDDVGPAWVGCTQGSSQGDCSSENAHWSTSVAGSKGSGDYAWAAQETNGKWIIKGAWLRVSGSDEIDIVKCNAKGDAKSEDVEIDDSD